jgi:Fe-S-cluster-containing dehydrogenase component
VASCPYDARFIHPDGYADKCTFCIHRVEKGLNPACVSVCPTRCMYFGDLDDPNSEVSSLLGSRKYYALMPEAGTKPCIYYLS